MNPTPPMGQIHPSFKHKISVQIRKPHRKSNSREGKQSNSGAEGDARSCIPGSTAVHPTLTGYGEYHGLPVVASGDCGSVAS